MSEETNLPDRLDDKQERALQMIILGEQDVEIAATLGINRKTIYRWRKYDMQFMRALNERQALMREMAQNGLLELTEGALEAVREALKDKDNRVRLQAARLVLDLLNVKKQEEKKGSLVLELLTEAIEGIKPELGLDEKL
jgi:DNA-binding CsgD family transcriptional regulator